MEASSNPSWRMRRGHGRWRFERCLCTSTRGLCKVKRERTPSGTTWPMRRQKGLETSIRSPRLHRSRSSPQSSSVPASSYVPLPPRCHCFLPCPGRERKGGHWRAKAQPFGALEGINGRSDRDAGDAKSAGRSLSNQTLTLAWLTADAQGQNSRWKPVRSLAAGTSCRTQRGKWASFFASTAGRIRRGGHMAWEPRAVGLRRRRARKP